MKSRPANEYQPDEVSPPRATPRELMEERGFDASDVAKLCSWTTPAVERLLDDAADAPVTEESANKLASGLGLSKAFWLKREEAYRESRRPDAGAAASGR